MKGKLVLVLASIVCAFSLPAHSTECTVTAGRKILHLGDSITDKAGILAAEADSGANMTYTTVLAAGGHTMNGTTPFAPEDAARPWWHDPATPTMWQQALTNEGHSISDYDGVVVELGTNDAGHVGAYKTTQQELIDNNIGTLLSWLQPNADRPVIWILPLYTKYPNSVITSTAIQATDSNACWCRFYTMPFGDTPEAPEDDHCSPSFEAYAGENGFYCRMTSEIRHEAADDVLAMFKIRKTLLEMEAQYPHLIIANDMADVVSYVSGGQENLYNHVPDGTHFDPAANDFFISYSTYLSGSLANNIDCRNALAQQTSWIDFSQTIFNEVNDHVLTFY